MKSFFDTAAEGMIRPSELYEAKNDEALFINRELSWMEFNDRVLEEARDKENPLYERLNFLGITCSNLDEFFIIRAATLIDLVRAGGVNPDPSGLKPKEQLSKLMQRHKEFFKKQYSTFNRQILPALAKEGIYILSPAALKQEQIRDLRHYFKQRIFPVLTPIAVDSARPMPLIPNQSLNLLVLFKQEPKGENHKGQGGYPPFAIVQIPSNLPRLIKVPDTDRSETRLILLEELVRLFLNEVFENTEILSSDCFRIMRNADFDIDEDEAYDLLEEIEIQVRLRRRGEVIRLELQQGVSEQAQKILQELLGTPKEQTFWVNGPIDLSFAFMLPSFSRRDDLHYKPFVPQASPGFSYSEDPFECIRRGDILLHHPYESFDPVIDVIQKAAKDPQVLAIKQTLYRVSGQSPIIAALSEAAARGKQVLVLVELKARFDEERNIHWARELEKAGCHVIYGLKGLKTHSKITMIVREEEVLRRYVHLGTGNYNDKTAKVYTDIGIWSCSEALGRDATNFFNMLSGYSFPKSWSSLIPAPVWLRRDTLFRIAREKENAEKGLNAMIVGKINSLVDPEIIRALYEASQAGVTIRLIVRGISCLRPGIKGVSENIEVRSLVGRFLEHSRIFYYYNNGEEDLMIGSADWMPRNLNSRVELMVSVRDPECRRRIFEILELELADTERAWIEQADGLYHTVDRRGKTILDSQKALCDLAVKAASDLEEELSGSSRFEPIRNNTEERGAQ